MTTYIIVLVVVLLLAYTITRGVQNDNRDKIIDTSNKWAESNWSIVLNELKVKPKNKLANRLWEYSVADKQFDITHVISRSILVNQLNEIEDLDVLLEKRVIIINENGEFVISESSKKDIAGIKIDNGYDVTNNIVNLLNTINRSKTEPFQHNCQYIRIPVFVEIIKNFKQKTQ